MHMVGGGRIMWSAAAVTAAYTYQSILEEQSLF